MTVGSWKGRSENLAPIYLKTLQLDDYLLVDYQRDDQVVNLYVAYYSSQQSGAAVHSPRSCLPGGGWEMVNQEERIVGNPRANGRPMKVNRVIIKKGEYSQLVYYWFQQRGRDITDEVLLRWYVLWDALKRHRTDGALIRLTTQIKPGEEISAADQRLTELSKEIIPLMPAYIPN
jgi:EpsI family protein